MEPLGYAKDKRIGDATVNALTHELAHIIDRHDPHFTGGLSPKEFDAELERFPDVMFASVLVAFDCFLNAYIDGRLERRGTHHGA